MKTSWRKKSIRLDAAGGEGDPLGSVQESKIWPYEQIVYVQTRTWPGEWDAQITLLFWDINRSSNLGQTTRLSDIQQKKKKN